MMYMYNNLNKFSYQREREEENTFNYGTNYVALISFAWAVMF